MRQYKTEYVQNLVRFTIHGYDFSLRELGLVVTLLFVAGILVGGVFLR